MNPHCCCALLLPEQNDDTLVTTFLSPNIFLSLLSLHAPSDERRRHRLHPTARNSPRKPAPIMLAAASSSSSWLRARRSRYLFLLLCSPILLPFLCATFPLLCAAELCLRICRRSRRWGKIPHDSTDDEDERLRRCEEGCCGGTAEREEVGLLQRYLEDQLMLVGSVYDCGDDDEVEDSSSSSSSPVGVGGGGGGGDGVDYRTPLLS